MSVYFVKAQGLIKIGYSANPNVRTSTVLSQFYEGGEVLGIMPGGRDLEAFLHEKFAAHRTHGEWFHPHDDILNFIALIGAPTIAPADKADERTLVQIYEDKYAEDSADCLHAARRKDGQTPMDGFYASITAWTGISVRRLKDIYAGKADSISSAEYTLMRALGEAAGFSPSKRVDGIAARVGDPAGSSADRMGGE